MFRDNREYPFSESPKKPDMYTIADTPLTLAPLTGGPTGHTFDGWYDNASFSGSPVTGIPANSTGDKTFYAKWNIIRSVKVTDDGNGSGEANPTSGTEGTVVTLTASPNSGFAFEKWEVVSGGVTVSNNKFTIGTSNVEVRAIFKPIPPNTYSVTVSNDGNGTGTADPTYGAQGTSVTLTASPNSGYRFKEWQVVSGGVTVTGNKFTIGTSNAEIKAIFEKIPASSETKTVMNGLNSVPAALLSTFSTVAAIEDALLQRLNVDRTTANGRWVSYDVKLQISNDGGKTWIDATPANFPSGGLTVTLPYPSGTGRNTHTFKVAHMFTVAMNGHAPGEVETPPVTNGPNGIQVTLHGLSPVVITWEEKTGDNPSNPGGGGSSGGSSGSGTYTPTPVPQIKPNFDSRYYADTYPDLKEAFGYDHDALWNHYVMFGKNEKRKVRFILNINKFREGIFNYSDRWQMDDVMRRKNVPASAYFDTDAYADLYPDLKAAFGYNHELLYKHYLEYGRYEGRKIYTRNIFNAKAYADRYADLKKVYGYDKVALWRHYQLHGKAERRYVEWLEEEEADKDTK